LRNCQKTIGNNNFLTRFFISIPAKQNIEHEVDAAVDAVLAKNLTALVDMAKNKSSLALLEGKWKKVSPVPAPDPCTFIPGGPINAAPAVLPCLTASASIQVFGRMFRSGDPPVACNVTPKAYGGDFATGTLYDVVVLTSPAPPSGTCVTVDMDSSGTCGSGMFMTLWSGPFNTTLTNWPSTSPAGAATFQNDPGSSLADPVPMSFTVPPGVSDFSIVLTSTGGLSSCTYGNMTLTYT